MSNWKPKMIAQCVKSHSEGVTVAGRNYRVFGVKTCACGMVLLDLGFIWESGSECDCCRNLDNVIWWQDASRFRPLDSLSEQVERIEEAFVSAPAEGETLETVEV